MVTSTATGFVGTIETSFGASAAFAFAKTAASSSITFIIAIVELVELLLPFIITMVGIEGI